ncbi:MAG: GTP-binding protein [Candidatus Thorarchaeota archaeon]
MTESLSWQFKVCLIGDGYVGKTSIRRKYIGEGFRSNYIPTLGVDFAQKYTETQDGNARLVIWDIAGQTQFQSLRRRYYEGCSGLILVYSVVDRESFDNASKWLVEAHGFMEEFPPLIIVANKIDLRNYYPEEDLISHDEGEEFTKKISDELNTPAIFIETSALTGENIDDAFNRLTAVMIDPSSAKTVEAEKEQPIAETDTAIVGESYSAAPSVQVDAEISEQPASAISAEEAQIGQDMTELVELRARQKRAEQDLRDYSLEIETKLLTLRNTVHVKKIMYEHLRQQLSQTRQEWADAYEEHVKLDEQKKTEIDKKLEEIRQIKTKIDEIESQVKKQVQDLEFD